MKVHFELHRFFQKTTQQMATNCDEHLVMYIIVNDYIVHLKLM